MKSIFTFKLLPVFALVVSFSFAQQKSSGILNINPDPDLKFTKFKNDQPLSAEDQVLLNQIIGIKNTIRFNRIRL